MLLCYFFHPTIALAMARFIVGLRFLSVFDTTGMVIAWAGCVLAAGGGWTAICLYAYTLI